MDENIDSKDSVRSISLNLFREFKKLFGFVLLLVKLLLKKLWEKPLVLSIVLTVVIALILWEKSYHAFAGIALIILLALVEELYRRTHNVDLRLRFRRGGLVLLAILTAVIIIVAIRRPTATPSKTPVAVIAGNTRTPVAVIAGNTPIPVAVIAGNTERQLPSGRMPPDFDFGMFANQLNFVNSYSDGKGSWQCYTQDKEDLSFCDTKYNSIIHEFNNNVYLRCRVKFNSDLSFQRILKCLSEELGIIDKKIPPTSLTWENNIIKYVWKRDKGEFLELRYDQKTKDGEIFISYFSNASAPPPAAGK